MIKNNTAGSIQDLVSIFGDQEVAIRMLKSHQNLWGSN